MPRMDEASVWLSSFSWASAAMRSFPPLSMRASRDSKAAAAERGTASVRAYLRASRGWSSSLSEATQLGVGLGYFQSGSDSLAQ